MWLMSQNRDVLVNVNDICFYEVNKDSEIIYQFRCYGYGDDYYILGEYSTEEKALRVMDMIQKQIGLLEVYKLCVLPINKTEQFVFQMSKDEEVE